MSANPFQSPVSATAGSAELVAPHVDRFMMIGELAVRWEKLRWIYNAILAGVMLLTSGAVLGLSGNAGQSHLLSVDGFAALCFAFLGANACFTLGPLVDGYLSWFGFRNEGTTWVLFILGTLLSIGLTMIASYILTTPNFFPGMM